MGGSSSVINTVGAFETALDLLRTYVGCMASPIVTGERRCKIGYAVNIIHGTCGRVHIGIEHETDTPTHADGIKEV